MLEPRATVSIRVMLYFIYAQLLKKTYNCTCFSHLLFKSSGKKAECYELRRTFLQGLQLCRHYKCHGIFTNIWVEFVNRSGIITAFVCLYLCGHDVQCVSENINKWKKGKL